MGQPKIGNQIKEFRLPSVWMVVLVVMVVDLALIALGCVWLQNHRQQYQDRAIVTSQNIGRLLEQSIADSIERTDLSLNVIGDEISRQMSAGKIEQQRLNAFIARQHARMPDLDGIWVSDAAGNIRYGTNIPEEVEVSIAADSHFQYLRDNPEAMVTMSKPQISPIGKKSTIMLARRYNRPDGAFAGVISGVIDLDFFDMLFSSLNVGAKGTIVLRDDNLGLIVRYPELNSGGDIIGNNSVSPRYRELLMVQPYKGTFVAQSELDHVERVYSYQKIGKWPLYIQVGLATVDNLVEWRKTVNNSMFFGALFLLLSFVLALVTSRYWSERKSFFEATERKPKEIPCAGGNVFGLVLGAGQRISLRARDQ